MRCPSLGIFVLCSVLPLNGCTGEIGGGAIAKVDGEDTGVSGDDTGAPPDDTGAPPPDDTGGPPPDDTGTPPPTDTGPPPGDYPTGPYGSKVGLTFPNQCWMGYRDGKAGKDAGKYESICLADYYDPSGTKNITAIRVIGAALW